MSFRTVYLYGLKWVDYSAFEKKLALCLGILLRELFRDHSKSITLKVEMHVRFDIFQNNEISVKIRVNVMIIATTKPK